MKINSLLLIEATLCCFIRVEDIIKINTTYNIIQSLCIIIHSAVYLYPPSLSLLFLFSCACQWHFFPSFSSHSLLHSSFKICFDKREKRVWHLQEKCRQHYYKAIIITCRDRTLTAHPHFLSFFLSPI